MLQVRNHLNELLVNAKIDAKPGQIVSWMGKSAIAKEDLEGNMYIRLPQPYFFTCDGKLCIGQHTYQLAKFSKTDWRIRYNNNKVWIWQGDVASDAICQLLEDAHPELKAEFDAICDKWPALVS